MAKKSITSYTIQKVRNSIFECTDSDIQRINATRLIQSEIPRDPESMAARLSRQFLDRNWEIFNRYDVQASQEYDGRDVWLVLRTGLQSGAFPLFSPTSGKPDYGMIIRPRFEWDGLGAMLAKMGWRIIPTLVDLPLLPGSEKKVPPWVLSSIVIIRIQQLLNILDRKFELINSTQSFPKGTVNWSDYASKKIPEANFLSFNCRFPDLRDDRSLKAAIHYTLRKQKSSLESQRYLTGAVLSLLDLCQSLIQRVSNVQPLRPTPEYIQAWFSSPYHIEPFINGIQAIEWTINERGLAGISDMKGIPWILPLDCFFESWMETLVSCLPKRIGGIAYFGRKKQTISPIHWDNAYIGTQKSLIPDAVLECDETTYIFDAKYKRHWEEFNSANWFHIEKEIQEQHRQDLLQVLAYSTLKNNHRVVSCLIYPCQPNTWESLKARGQLFRHASIPANDRRIEIILTAVPMNSRIEETVDCLQLALRSEIL
jgi:hypothetical protein